MATVDEIRAHYDTSPELFELFLDRRFRAYSAGRWLPGDNLETAQNRNLSAIIISLNITPATAVLDIGCGWGALATACVGNVGVRRYVGLTPSPAQIGYIKTQLNGGAELYETTWQDFPSPRDQFDAVVALESVEHIASLPTRRNGDVTAYHRFFDFSAQCSTAAARLYVQTSVTRRPPRTRSERADVRFILFNVFPGSALADLETLKRSSDRVYALERSSWGAADYLMTLHAWNSRLQAVRSVFAGRFGQDAYDFYEQYLATCIRLFDSGVVELLRAQFAKK